MNDSVAIISWNVNGFRAVERKGAWQELLDTYHPQIVCVQEIKGTPDKFPNTLTQPENYMVYFHPAQQPGYSGTSIWIHKDLRTGMTNVVYTTSMKNDPVANEGRISELCFTYKEQQYAVLGVYFPNGGKSAQAWEQKLVFYASFLKHVNARRSAGKTVIFCGDVNCAHNPIDLARPNENDGAIGFHPDERAWIDAVIAADWVDVFRHLHPTTKEVYSWWHMVTRARSRNIGWRIDYFFCPKQLVEHVTEISYLVDHQGSDHCPVLLRYRI